MKSGISAAKTVCAALALGVVSFVTLTAQAQAPGSAPAVVEAPATESTQPPNPELKLSQQKLLESFEPGIHEEYQMGPGDEITLDFPGRPELAGKHTIGPDGRITVQLAGSILLTDLTREEASKAIATALSAFYTDLTVTVKIDKYSSNRVRVLGYVQHPGEILFEGTPTLLDAIGKAGLIAPQVSSGGVSSNVGASVPETCTIYRGNSTAVQVDLRTLLLTGNSLADMRLRRNDIVFVPQPKEQFVSVLGEVSRPGNVPITAETTLTSILAQSGCCTDSAGGSPDIHIIQASTGKDFKVNYKKVMTIAGQHEFTLHSGDVILVPKSGFYKVTNVIQKISSVATLVSLAAFVGAG